MTKNRSKNTTQKKKLFKNKHKGTSSAASNSCSCLNLSLVKGAGIWGGKSGFESEILSAAPPKSFEIYGEKDFLITPPQPPETKNHPLKRGGDNFSMTLPNIFAIHFVLSVTRHFITLDTAISKSSCVTC